MAQPEARPPAPEQPLFRKEAVAHRTRALFGDVVLRGSLPGWILTGLLASLVIGALLFGLIYRVDGAPLWRWMLGQI